MTAILLAGLLGGVAIFASSCLWFEVAARVGANRRVRMTTALAATVGGGVSMSAIGVGALVVTPVGALVGLVVGIGLVVWMTALLLRTSPARAALVAVLHALGVGVSVSVVAMALALAFAAAVGGGS